MVMKHFKIFILFSILVLSDAVYAITDMDKTEEVQVCKKRLHKELQKGVNYIDPGYGRFKFVKTEEIRSDFNGFTNKKIYDMVEKDDQAPKEFYKFNSHYGAFLRSMESAKNEYIMAMAALYEDEDSIVGK